MAPFPFIFMINIIHYKIIIVQDPDRIDLGAIINNENNETENVKNHAVYYRLLSILSEKSATITIAIGEKWTFGHP